MLFEYDFPSSYFLAYIIKLSYSLINPVILITLLKLFNFFLKFYNLILQNKLIHLKAQTWSEYLIILHLSYIFIFHF